jgi:glycosyltransferase involved in cell wall biosynthesis
MKFSLILATINRTVELKRFLIALEKQSFRDFELIVVDQNNDDRLSSLLKIYDNFPIRHIKSFPGLSHARNVGLNCVGGDIICFPDDDCWYSCDVLEKVERLFQENPHWDGLTGRTLDEQRNPTLNRWAEKSGYIAVYQPWMRVTSPAVFLRRRLVEKVGEFDETLGVGSGTAWGSGEEIDYIVRAIKLGFHIWYEYNLEIGHPDPIAIHDQQSIRRGYNYAMGFGRVQRKHGFPLSQVIYFWLRSFAGLLISSLSGNINKSKFYWAVLLGRVKGWLS